MRKTIRAEHAANVSVELVYRGKGHRELPPGGHMTDERLWHPRVYWIPPHVCDEIYDIDISRCVGYDPKATAELRSILCEIELRK